MLYTNFLITLPKSLTQLTAFDWTPGNSTSESTHGPGADTTNNTNTKDSNILIPACIPTNQLCTKLIVYQMSGKQSNNKKCTILQ